MKNIFGRTYTITEGNYKKILKKIQKITNKFYMHNAFKTGKTGRRIIRTFGKVQYVNKNGVVKTKIYNEPYFIITKEHSFKIEYDKRQSGEKSDDVFSSLYENLKPLIHFSLDTERACVIYLDDEITFYPFGIFKHCQKELYGEDYYYCYSTYIPYIFKRVKNIDTLIEERRQEEERVADAYNDCFKEEIYNEDLMD